MFFKVVHNQTLYHMVKIMVHKAINKELISEELTLEQVILSGLIMSPQVTEKGFIL